MTLWWFIWVLINQQFSVILIVNVRRTNDIDWMCRRRWDSSMDAVRWAADGECQRPASLVTANKFNVWQKSFPIGGIGRDANYIFDRSAKHRNPKFKWTKFVHRQRKCTRWLSLRMKMCSVVVTVIVSNLKVNERNGIGNTSRVTSNNHYSCHVCTLIFVIS